MPEIDGYELLRRIRANPKLTKLPAIAVSGMQRDRDIANAHAAGFSAHIGKPISVERLNIVVKDLMRGSFNNEFNTTLIVESR
jgi:two-component system CheB/CheR fusion protein